MKAIKKFFKTLALIAGAIMIILGFVIKFIPDTSDNSNSVSSAKTQSTNTAPIELTSLKATAFAGSSSDVLAKLQNTNTPVSDNGITGGVDLEIAMKNVSQHPIEHAWLSFQIEYNNTVYKIPDDQVLVTTGYEDLDLTGGSTLAPNQKTPTISITIGLPSDLVNVLDKQHSLSYNLHMFLEVSSPDSVTNYKMDKVIKLTSTIPTSDTSSN